MYRFNQANSSIWGTLQRFWWTTRGGGLTAARSDAGPTERTKKKETDRRDATAERRRATGRRRRAAGSDRWLGGRSGRARRWRGGRPRQPGARQHGPSCFFDQSGATSLLLSSTGPDTHTARATPTETEPSSWLVLLRLGPIRSRSCFSPFFVFCCLQQVRTRIPRAPRRPKPNLAPDWSFSDSDRSGTVLVFLLILFFDLLATGLARHAASHDQPFGFRKKRFF